MTMSRSLLRFRVIFKAGRLHVAAECRDRPGFLDDLIATLMGVWRFITFSESRWLTIRPSCRVLMAASLTGIESLVAYARRGGNKEYYIHNFDRLSVAT